MEYNRKDHYQSSSLLSPSWTKYDHEEPDVLVKKARCSVQSYFGVLSVPTMICAVLFLSLYTYLNIFSHESASSYVVISSYSDYSVTTANSLFSVLVANDDYGIYDPTVNSYGKLNGTLLVEPYRTTTIALSEYDTRCSYDLAVSEATAEDSDDGDDVYNQDTSVTDVDGYSWTVLLTKPGNYNVTISRSCDSSVLLSGNDTLRRLTTTDDTIVDIDSIPVWVKYVRRELSSLSDNDREEFLEALYTLYTVNTVDGRALYGENYVSVQYLASIHVDAAGNPVCDEFHSGDGFFGNHVFISNYLEQSLRQVNPRVSLHFMEYAPLYSSDSFEDHLSNQLDGGTWIPYLSDTYFGSNHAYSGDVLDSRWANFSVPVVNATFFLDHNIEENSTFFPEEESEWLTLSSAHLRSPFGLLRPPWNFNPSTRLSRYNNEVGITTVNNDAYSEYFRGSNCTDYEKFINEIVLSDTADDADDGSTVFNTMLRYVKSYAHGGIHESIGGSGGVHAREIDDALRSEYGFTDEDILVISERAHAFFKKYVPQASYYNDSTYPVYPINCTVTKSADDSQWSSSCVCVDYYFESQETFLQLLTLYFDKYTRSSYEQSSTYFLLASEDDDAFDFATRVQIMRLICQRNLFDGDFVGSGSAYDPIFWVSHPPMELLLQRIALAGYLPASSDATSSSSSIRYIFTQSATCSGHNPDSNPYWLRGYKLHDSNRTDASTFTNAELVSMLDPDSEDYWEYIPYVYDSSHLIGCSTIDTMLSTKLR